MPDLPDSADAFALPRLSAAEALRRFSDGALILLDLRKPAAVERSGHRIRGALCRDPFVLSHDDDLTRAPGPVAVFCVHGHEVSRFGCALLMLHGVDAAFVTGGFVALVAAGASLEPAP